MGVSELLLEVGDARFLCTHRFLFTREGLHRQQQGLARVTEGLLAGAGGGVQFPFVEVPGLRADLVLVLQLREALAGGVVVLRGRLAGKLQRALLETVGEIRDVRWQAGQGRGIAFDACTEVPPEPLQGVADRLGRAAAERLADRLDCGGGVCSSAA